MSRTHPAWLILLATTVFAGQAAPPPFPSSQSEQIAWLDAWSRTGTGHQAWLDKQAAIVPLQTPAVRFAARYWFGRTPMDERKLLEVIRTGRHNRYEAEPPKVRKGEAQPAGEVFKPAYDNASEETVFTAAPRFTLAISDGGRVAWVVHLVVPVAQTVTITAVPPEGKHELRWTLDGQALPAKRLGEGLATPLAPGLHVLVGFATFREQQPAVPFAYGLSVAGQDLWQMIATGLQKATYDKYQRILAKEAKP